MTMNTFQLKRDIFTIIAKIFLSHKSNVTKDAVTYQFDEGELLHYSDSSNKMIKTPAGFFRFCEEWHPKYLFVQKSLEYYIEYSNFLEEEKAHVIKCFKDKNNLDKLISLGVPKDRHSRFNKFVHSNDTSFIGISNPYLENDTEYNDFIINCKKFAWFIKNELYNYSKNRKCTKRLVYNANRQMAEASVANMLGVNHIITQLHFCKLNIGPKEYIGTMSEIAPGDFYYEKQDLVQNLLTGAIQRDLLSLNLLDVICYEGDHRPGNYHIVNNQSGGGIIALDNDSPKAFFVSSNCNIRSSAKYSPLIKDGIINRPYFDKVLVDNLLHLTYHNVKKTLSPFLNELQIFCCWRRICKLKTAVRKSLKSNKDFLLCGNEWSFDTIKRELSGDFGNTYLKALIQRDIDWKINGIQEADKYAN